MSSWKTSVARRCAPAAVLVACGCGSALPGGDGRDCTSLACVDGFTVAFSPSSGWQPGAYRFTLDVDGETTTCEGALPLRPCDAGPSLQCSPVSQRVTIGESGCALPPEQHGFAGLVIGGAPAKRVSVTIGRDDQNLVQKTFTPTYTTSQPNGEGCEPVCRSSSDSLTIPGAAR